jgi:uncharacterized protein
MQVIGEVSSLWRYPVKSMRGESLPQIFAGYAGVYGDRVYAFRSSARAEGFPFFNACVQSEMLQYRPRFRTPESSVAPPHLDAAEKMTPTVTPLYGGPDDLLVDVETPQGDTLAIDDPELVTRLLRGMDVAHQLTLLRSDRALTDCRPLSLISAQTIRQLGREGSAEIDPRRFRANVYLDLNAAKGFAEDQLVGRTLRIANVVVSILLRDPRCVMIALDPDTGEKRPAILKQVAQDHENCAGVYAAILSEGLIREGDRVELQE